MISRIQCSTLACFCAATFLLGSCSNDDTTEHDPAANNAPSTNADTTTVTSASLDDTVAVDSATYGYTFIDGRLRYSFVHPDGKSWCVYRTDRDDLHCGIYGNNLQEEAGAPLPSCDGPAAYPAFTNYYDVVFRKSGACVQSGEHPVWLRGQDAIELNNMTFSDLPVLQAGNKLELSENVACSATASDVQCSYDNYRITLHSGGLRFTA